MSNILITGGTGRLGTELKKVLPDASYVGLENWDMLYEIPDNNEYDTVVHLAAYTNVVNAEKEKQKCYDTNVMGTLNILKHFVPERFIYISTEYAKDPLGVYAMSKYLGEKVTETHPNHLILRTSFKPNPFPFEYAYEDQWTQGDYVDVIAELLAEKIKTWNGKSNLEYLGTGRKTMFELAKRTRPDVKPNKVCDYKYSYLIPRDYE